MYVLNGSIVLNDPFRFIFCYKQFFLKKSWNIGKISIFFLEQNKQFNETIFPAIVWLKTILNDKPQGPVFPTPDKSVLNAVLYLTKNNIFLNF